MWFERNRQDWQDAKAGCWAIARDGGEVLDRIALSSVNFDNGVAGVGYWVVPAACGVGIATRALFALSAWALDEICFYRLHLDHSTQNQASCRVATKSDYLLGVTMRSSRLHDDGRHDMHLHARVREV